MSKVLITGATGFLGTKLYDMYSLNDEVLGTFFNRQREGLFQLDITNRAKTLQLISDFHPDTVIHTVALSDPDICEQRKEDAERINHLGTRNVVDGCREVGARLDYISTVYVFDGEKGNYTENDFSNPINWYGKTKLMAEQEVTRHANYGIYRFDKLYGYNSRGGSNDVFSKIAAGRPFEVNSDQNRQPLLIDDVGRALQLVQGRLLNGIFHLAGPDRLSKCELALRLSRLLGKESLVVPIPEKEQIARRPKDASIVTTKIESEGMVFTPLQEALTLIEGSLRTKFGRGKECLSY